MKEFDIDAVFESDLEKLLKQLDIYNDVIQGKVFCDKCSCQITLKNIHSIFPNNNEIKFCCTQKDCVEKLV